MWQMLSLRARLNVLFASVLLVGLAANITRLLVEAGPRVEAEDRSSMRLADAFASALLADLDEGDLAQADVRVARAFEGLTRLRHVTVVREGTGRRVEKSRDDADDEAGRGRLPPTWFVGLVKPEQMAVRIPLAFQGRDLGALIITSEPSDEISEIWDGIVTQLVVGSLLAMVLFMITAAVVRRALAPLSSLAFAMRTIEAGDYTTRVVAAGPPELAAICSQLDRLVAVLGRVIEDRRQLAGRLVSLQDTERKEIARDLHDEFGPYLFTLRAHLSSLESAIRNKEGDAPVLLKRCHAIAEQLSALQQVNREILERLRPAGLAELGLREALTALIRMWYEAKPEVTVRMTISASLGELDETTELTIYRVVQEALTNVFRHAQATSVEIVIEPVADRTRSAADGGRAVHVEVRDDGAGLSTDHKLGFGTVGMRERVMALGGEVDMKSTPAGLVVEALVPGRSTV